MKVTTRFSSVILVAFLACGLACPKSKPPQPSPPDSAPAAFLATSTPNHAATAFLRAMTDADTAALQTICIGEPVTFFAAVAENIALTEAVVAKLRALYPHEEHRPLDKMIRESKKSMNGNKNMKLVGRLSGSEAQGEVVYSYSYEHANGFPKHDEIVVKLIDGAWRVVSYGEFTPTSAYTGYVRTECSRFRWMAVKGLPEIIEKKPRSLQKAFELLAAATPKTTLENAPSAGPNDGAHVDKK